MQSLLASIATTINGFINPIPMAFYLVCNTTFRKVSPKLNFFAITFLHVFLSILSYVSFNSTIPYPKKDTL